MFKGITLSRKCLSSLKVIAALAVMALGTSAYSATLRNKTIKYPTGSYLAGKIIPLGVDPYGYNYQAHSFNGSYFNAYANADGLPPYTGDDAEYLSTNPAAAGHPLWPYRGDHLAMKWNDAWLSNADLDNDGKLDRPADYQGSGAWLTNHMSGEYADAGEDYRWNYFVKIVAVPSDANPVGDVGAVVWYDASGTEIGPEIWADFAVIQEVYNDSGTGDHGLSYRSPVGPGVGKF
jgi:hypothetical protein